MKTFLYVLFSIQFTAHLDEAGDVCGVVAGVGVLVPVHGLHGLTAAPTLATAWLEAAGPRNNPAPAAARLGPPPPARHRHYNQGTGSCGAESGEISLKLC